MRCTWGTLYRHLQQHGNLAQKVHQIKAIEDSRSLLVLDCNLDGILLVLGDVY